MSDQDSKQVPYGGTIRGEPAPTVDLAVKEWYRLPLKHKNEMVFSVKAASDAQLLLYDGENTLDSSNVKVLVVLGSDKNSTASVGLVKEDPTGSYGKELVQKEKLLSATHFKVFSVRWHYGRVMVYNYGYKKPFLTWDGPKDATFTHVGVRTVGCSGEWQVCGGADFTTADGAEYKEIQLNCGRFEFEACGFGDAWVAFSAEPKWNRASVMSAVVGNNWGAAGRSGIWSNISDVNFRDAPNPDMSMGEFRRFTVLWDSNNMWIGRLGADSPNLGRVRKPTVVKPIRYVGFQCNQAQDYVYFHVLDVNREEDTAQRQYGAQDAGDEVGILTYERQVTAPPPSEG